MRAGLSELSNALLEVHAWLHNPPPKARVKVDMTAPVQEAMLDKAYCQALDAARAISAAKD